MKQLNLLLLLILIASALFLNGAGECVEAPSAQQKQSGDTEDQIDSGKPNADAPKSSGVQPTTPQATRGHTYQIENYYYNSNEGWEWTGIIQAVATIGLLGLAWWQRDFIKKTALATEAAASAAKENAEAAKVAANAAINTTNAMQEEFISTHQPHIKLRRVVVTNKLPFEKGDFVRGNIQAVNWGETKAIIVSSHCEVMWCKGDLPMEPAFWKNGDLHNNFIPRAKSLGPGEPTDGSFKSEESLDDKADAINTPGGEWQLYVIGFISYRDSREPPHSRHRHVDFARRYDPAKRRFFQIEDADYESAP